MSISKNKIAGAVYGFAIGDAMGATTEFMTHEQIRKVYGKVTNIIGGGWLRLSAGEVTDDTQMSMCIMKAIMESTSYGFIRFVADEFVKWFHSGPKDVGGQCAKGISYYINTGQFIDYDAEAKGNGSLMRAMPCAIMCSHDFDLLNEAQGRITHNNPECSQVILEYSRLIQNYLNGILYTGPKKSLLEPSGYLWNTFNNSVYWSCKDSFKEAILGAVNHGGDADTIAAIAGGLAGAKFGYDEIPKEWICQLNPEVKIFLNNFINFAFAYVQKENLVV